MDPADLDDYRAHGGYTALRRAFALGPAGVIREVTDSGLLGRGGAAFPTGRKWQATASQPDHPHYLVCNADESEPGTFKDRVLMEGDPYALVEAMTIAAYATGARLGYLYLRGEYPRALERMEHAIAQARARGLLGDDVLGQGFSFDIEIRRGAGAYICGEETALFNSIEGYRGEPRSKPPFPVEKGLFGKPTVENNVETLVNVLPILTLGAPAYAAIGTRASTGPKLFCVSGSVARPGIYELPFGATLGELLTLAGVRDGLRAVLLGGAAGGFVRPDELDIPSPSKAPARPAPPSAPESSWPSTTRSRSPSAAAHRRVLPRRVLRAVRALPGRHGPPGGGAAPDRGAHRRGRRRRHHPAARGRARDAGRLDLRSGPDRVERRGIRHRPSGGVRMTVTPLGIPRRLLEFTLDGEPVRAPEGSTILDACRAAGKDIPTLCEGDTLTPKNACRVCVVEVEGSRTLVPACSRKAEAGMEVRTGTERARHSRKVVLELLASSVDLSTTPRVAEWLKEYEAKPDRFGPDAARLNEEPRVDNDLYVRDYGKCILCYKCVDACGDQWQNTFAISVAGRGFDARIAVEHDAPLTDSACVYCGNCIEVCPTGALSFKSEFDMRGRVRGTSRGRRARRPCAPTAAWAAT